jgi:hypothetical protein
MISALFVETGGCYFGLQDVDPWDIARDARNYSGPWPVIAHPPCQRWGRYWHGSPRKPHQFRLGDDGGCFARALASVRKYGGVLEHPAYSNAWNKFGLIKPSRGGWFPADCEGFSCHVEQGHYGHFSRKSTWLYSVGADLREMQWENGEQRLDPIYLEKHGYEKARRCGVMAMVGGKDKTIIRNKTPHQFRDILISIAQSVKDGK